MRRHDSRLPREVNRFSPCCNARSTVPTAGTMGPMPLRVAMLAAECEPWAKVGGLGDMVDALARALGRLRDSLDGLPVVAPVQVFLPRYRLVPGPAARAGRGGRGVRGGGPRGRSEAAGRSAFRSRGRRRAADTSPSSTSRRMDTC